MNTTSPFADVDGGLSLDSYKHKIRSLLEEHAKNVTNGEYVSGQREGEDDEIVIILERIRAGNVHRDEDRAAVQEGVLLEEARKTARAAKVCHAFY